MERKTSASATKEIFVDIMNDKRERSIFKNSFSCFMTDRSATEQEVNNIILSHDISHDLKSLKCFKFIQLSDVC